jgi:hypothetical protein
MARDGSGTYTNPHPDFVAGTVISSTEVDANNSDIATALTQSIAVDGQTTVTANLPMATYKFTGLGAGSAATDSANLGQVQAGSYIWCGTMAGGADAGTLSPAPAITAYAAGQRFAWKASTSANTGAMTVAISGLTTIAVQNDRAALAAGDHAASDIYMGILDTASTIQIMKVASVAGAVLGPASATDNAVARFDTTTGKLIQNSGVLITDTNEVTATGFTGTLDGVLGGGTPAAASITTLTLTNDLTVANGGTGASTFTANNVLLGNGTSALQVVAPSTSGNVLTSDGSTWASEAAAGGGELANHTVYTNSTRTTISNSNSGTLWTVSFNKLAAGTDLLITGVLYGYGNGGSGTTCATLKYGSGTEIHGGFALSQKAASDWTFGHAVAGHITGHTTTGAQNLVIGWDYASGTSDRPLSVLNPTSADKAAISTMVSQLQIIEVTT